MTGDSIPPIDDFSAQLLMPADQFTDLYYRCGLELTAQHFGVPISMARWRADELGLDA